MKTGCNTDAQKSRSVSHNHSKTTFLLNCQMWQQFGPTLGTTKSCMEEPMELTSMTSKGEHISEIGGGQLPPSPTFPSGVDPETWGRVTE